METPSAELYSCRRDNHVVEFCRTTICPTRNAGDWDADVVEVGKTVLTDTVKRIDCYFRPVCTAVALGANEARREEPA